MKKKYIFGAYGTNNVGDDAIFDGANTAYNGILTPIHVNKGNRPNSIWYGDVFNGVIKLDNNTHDELIMGGGGLLHCKSAVDDYYKMGKLAIDAGLKFSIERIGAEGQTPEFNDSTKRLLDISSSTSVRTTTSKEILDNLGYNVDVKKDFVYGYKHDKVQPKHLFNNNRKTIAFVLNSIHTDAMVKITGIIKKLLNEYNIILLPHAKAYMSIGNNDVVINEKLWSSVDIWWGDREQHLINLPYNSNVNEVLSVYKGVDLVVGTRFHSFIFSDLTNMPLVGITTGIKAEAYFKDNKNNKHDSINISKEENEIYKKIKEKL